MSRRLGLGLAAAGIVIVAAAVLVLGLGTSGTTEPAPSLPLRVETSIEPQPAFFGDLVTARARVFVDRERADPDGLEVTTDFTPFALVGMPRRTRSDGGRITALDYRFTLSCLTEPCLPGARGTLVPLAPVRVRAPARDGGTETALGVWPRVDLRGRVDESAATVAPVPWRLQTALPPVSYRTDPGRLSALLALAAAALGALGVALVAMELARRARIRRERARALSGLARALELARESVEREPDDRRRALSLLARALAFEANGNGELADSATRLAWARPEPAPASVAALVEEVERSVARR